MKVIQSFNELIKFGEAHKHINIYGAGVYANKIANNVALKNKKFDIDAFLVNDLSNNPQTLGNIPVKLATDPKIPRDKAVLISLGYDIRDEVVLYLEKEGYTNLAVITEMIRFDLSSGCESLIGLINDKLITESKTYDTPPPPHYLQSKTSKISEGLYEENKKAFLEYKYIWKKTFPAFYDIKQVEVAKITIEPQDKELFEQLKSNLPILLKNCYDTDWLKRMCGRLRSSEKYGSDNRLPKSVKLQLQNASQVLHHLQLQDFYCFTQWVKQELSLSESK